MEDLMGAQYDVEVWAWKTNTLVADITGTISGGINMTWTLNDSEDLDFELDLIQLEKLCSDMGVSVSSILTPYVHDIRVKREGSYILGCQVVETNIKIDNDKPPTIQVRCTGFLNLFKDQYISEPMAGYTYPVMAHKLLNRAQHADPIIKNPTIDIDRSYWLTDNGSVAYTTSSPKAGKGCLQITRSGTGWNTAATQMRVNSGTQIKVDMWVKGQSGVVITVLERELLTKASNQRVIASVTPSSTGWTHLVSGTYTTGFTNGYLYVQQNRTNTTNLFVDNVFVSRIDDQDSLHDLKVGTIYAGLDDTTGGTGHNYATSGYTSSRTYNYELQNVKDAVMDLTAMGDDNFDFEFTPDRIFNTYSRKGADKPLIEAVYPGNIYSMEISRSAANLANKITVIGSGIGDKRLEAMATNTASRQTYGTRESLSTSNSTSVQATLNALASGILKERKDPTNLPKVVIRDGSISPGNVQVGDGIIVRISNGDSYLGTINGMYRIMQLSCSVDNNGVEQVTLTLELEATL